ncbi:hypothetical protein Pcinc_025542 [Petrolisthes cinctipes]|uniref:C2H2-type domain-containing protein n=1 Tax=Petrolisthes cinctipes TaxID=88211 RepID=A0AAE1FAB0_PETCI|nr:hypothetical protein Pcinc_025542 [Petrolisthes cinctipes]
MRPKITVSETRSILESCIEAGEGKAGETPSHLKLLSPDETFKFQHSSHKATLKYRQSLNDSGKSRLCSNETLKLQQPQHGTLKLRQSSNEALKRKQFPKEVVKHKKSKNGKVKHKQSKKEILKHKQSPNVTLQHKETTEKTMKLKQSPSEILKLRQSPNETLKHKQSLKETMNFQESTNRIPKLPKASNEMQVTKSDTKSRQSVNEMMHLNQTLSEMQKSTVLQMSESASQTKLQQATEETREILSSCVMEEGMTSAVEFLSVECDMILEPECDLETDDLLLRPTVMGHANGFGFHLEGGDNNSLQGDGDFILSPHDDQSPSVVNYTLPNNDSEENSPSLSSDPALPIVYRSPLIGELFQHRGVVVYKRSSQDSPFVKIYHPNLYPLPNGVKNGKLGSRKRAGESNSESFGDGHQNGRQAKRDRRDPGRGRTTVYRCGKCRKQFGSKVHLLTHRLVHVVRTGDTYACPVCESDFPTKAALKIHIQRRLCLRNVQNQFRERKQRQTQLRNVTQTSDNHSKSISKNFCVQENTMVEASSIHEYNSSPLSATPLSDDHSEVFDGQNSFELYGHAKSSGIQQRIPSQTAQSSRGSSDDKTSISSTPTTAKTNQVKCKSCKTKLVDCPNVSKDRRTKVYCDKCRSKHKRSHRERKSYECPECGSQYRKSSALKKHRRLEHDVT